jgi:hypothetical protein
MCLGYWTRYEQISQLVDDILALAEQNCVGKRGHYARRAKRNFA